MPSPHGTMSEKTTISLTTELADELYARKGRGETYEDVIWRALERSDREGGQDTPPAGGGDPEPRRDPEPEPVDSEPERSAEAEEIVERVAESWDDDYRLADRKAAATAVLAAALDRGQMGKQEALELRGEYPVNGQNEESWWRKNIRPALKEIGTYSNGKAAYVVEGQ